ncbi:unnamed protein product [Rangifer tarandus platyrhynchus]|uniref:Uncharacterized protein n=1 Tax=Rangifer tarandus platyrhynchus TaxID=3082113 RepID=A0ACB1KG08_RANTA
MNGAVIWTDGHMNRPPQEHVHHIPANSSVEMATHSSILAWRIPGTGEPGGLPSVGSHRVGHDRSDLAAAATVNVSRVIDAVPAYCRMFIAWNSRENRGEWSRVEQVHGRSASC